MQKLYSLTCLFLLLSFVLLMSYPIKHCQKQGQEAFLLYILVGDLQVQVLCLGHYYPALNQNQRQYKKRKLQANISDEHKCKSPQQNTSKPKSEAH